MDKISRTNIRFGVTFVILIMLTCAVYARQHNASIDTQDLNITHVLEQYIAFCGHNQLCFENDTFAKTSYLEFEKITHCPQCSCDNNCLFHFNCCIDLYLRFPPLTCRRVDIEEFKSKYDEEFLLVDNCPQGTNVGLAENCREKNASHQERFLHPPVTSSGKYKITFKNEYCAICNGYVKFSPWNINISCPTSTDFNYFSSYDEIFQEVRENLCSVSFYPENDDFLILCNKTKIVTSDMDLDSSVAEQIETCNSTKSLRTLDLDVMRLCESEYGLQYDLPDHTGVTFKNVFCFICNPPYYDDDVISTCNESGVWNEQDVEIEKACMEYPLNVAVYPSKNIFCHICNIDANDMASFQEFKVDFAEHNNRSLSSSFYRYEVVIKSIKSNYLLRKYKIDEMKTDVNMRYTNDVYLEFERRHDVNLTNLFIQRTAYGPVPLCSFPDLMYMPTQGCTCNILDLQCKARCCYDFALVYPVSCYPSSYVDKYHPYAYQHHLMVDGCLNNTSRRLSDLCAQNKITDTVFTSCPATLSRMKTTYRNLFCAICNIEEDSLLEDKVEKIVFYKIRIECPLYITFNSHIFLQSILDTATKMKCMINFIHPTDSASVCLMDTYKGRCNVTGKLEIMDKDVDWACKHVDFFRTEHFLPDSFPLLSEGTMQNEFCNMCNPHVASTEQRINKCNVSGYWLDYDQKIEKACNDLPESSALFPYKNKFCKFCNEPKNTDDLPSDLVTHPPFYDTSFIWRSTEQIHFDNPTTPDDDKDRLGLLSFRNIFSLAQYERQESHNMQDECQNEQIYDFSQRVCRNLSCYPGKVLVNSTCISVFKKTNNLRYVVTFNAEVEQFNGNDTQKIMEEYRRQLIENLSSSLKTEKFSFEELHMLSSKPCNYHYKNNTLEFSVYAKVFIKGTVLRLETEEKLLSFTNKSLPMKEPFQGMSLDQKYSRRALQIPLLTHESNFDQQCYRRFMKTDKNDTYASFRKVHVAPLLLCTLIYFERHEYRMSYNKMSLMLLKYDKKFLADEFRIVKDGEAAVCLDNVQFYLSNIETGTTFATTFTASILSVVCISISILCLIITLLTYILFRQLRSLPGKINICMISSLLLGQVLLTIQPNITDIDTLCLLVGSLSHFAWLSYFAWLGVSTYHMYKVFARGLHRNGPDENKILIKYVLFSFGLSAIIVTTIVIVSLARSDGRETGYSTYQCFIADEIVFILSLLVPLACMCASNVLLFVFTAYKISRTPKVQKNKTDTLQVTIYLKLFILTGISWTVSIVYFFLSITFLRYISIILNLTQGLYIFLVCICNRRVMRLYKELLCKISDSTATSSPSHRRV